MKSKKQLLKTWKVYALLDSSLISDKEVFLKKGCQLLEADIDVLQLRVNDYDWSWAFEPAKKIVNKSNSIGKPVLINDRPEIALMLDAKGVHLGKADIKAEIARKILGEGAIIGRTIRNMTDYLKIDKKIVDYIALGPAFRTKAKKKLKQIKTNTLKEVISKVKLPLVTIGGINKDNVKDLAKLGVKTVAVMSYATESDNIAKRIYELRKEVKRLR